MACGCSTKGLRGGGSRRRKRVRKAKRLTMKELKARNVRAGHHYFDKDTLRFFKSRVGSDVFPDAKGCVLFVTSEQGPHSARRYSVRRTCDLGGRISTVGKFQQYGSRSGAVAAAKRIARKGGR